MQFNDIKTPAIVLDCDLRSQEGIIQSLGKRDVPIVALSSMKTCPAFRSRFVHKRIVSPDINKDAQAYVDFLINLPLRGVIIYSNDVSAVILGRNLDKLRKSGYLLNLPKPDVLEEVFDKWQCFELSQSLDIPFPRSRIINSPQDGLKVWDEFDKPVIVKGTRLAGGNYVKISEKHELESAFQTVCDKTNSDEYGARESDVMLQEWLDYEVTDIWHCETVYDKKSQAMGFFTLKNIRTSFSEQGDFGSRLYAGEYMHSPEVVALTKKLLDTVGWQGFANIDYVYVPDREKYYLLDVNPRLPGFSYFPSQAGYEMAWYYYCDLIEKSYTIPHDFPKRYYFETLRYPGDVSDGIKYIVKGYLSWPLFINSYFKALFNGNQTIFEPVKLDDMPYTIATQVDNVKRFFTRALNFIQRKLKIILSKEGG